MFTENHLALCTISTSCICHLCLVHLCFVHYCLYLQQLICVFINVFGKSEKLNFLCLINYACHNHIIIDILCCSHACTWCLEIDLYDYIALLYCQFEKTPRNSYLRKHTCMYIGYSTVIVRYG